jgi:membrane protease subunit HflC
MLHSHSHDHHHHGAAEDATTTSRLRIGLRFAVALVICLGAVLVACGVMVSAGQAVVVTRFGYPVAVLTEPGLAWKWPMPIEGTIPVDLRMRTTSTGEQDVGTRDGLRILVQAYVAWRVPSDPDRIRQFLRTVGSFDLADLVNTDPNRTMLTSFETKLDDQVAPRVLDIYGIAIGEVGIERLGLPAETLAATVARMKAEREVVATQVTTEGTRAAAAIRSDAERDARVTIAQATAEAAATEAASQQEAARIQAGAYASDPSLYLLLRSLDTLGTVIGSNTRIVLRTDAAPFHILVEGPPTGTAPPSGTPQ